MQNNTPDNLVKKEIDYIANDIRGKSNPPDIVSLYANGNPFIGKPAQKDVVSEAIKGIDNKSVGQSFGNIKQSEIYTPLSDGSLIAKFDAIPNGITSYKGLEEHYAQNQSAGDKWGNGITKFLGKTGVGVIGGTIGAVNGVINWAKEGSFQSSYDNGFNDWLDDLNTKMDYNLPNYYTNQEKENGFLSNMGTHNFWANDVLGGLSFTTGALVSEGLWAWASGGTSLGTTAARLAPRLGRLTGRAAEVGGAMNKAVGTIKAGGLRSFANDALPATLATRLGKTGDLINTARFTYTSAGYESGFEARHYMKEASEGFLEDFERLNGRKPTYEESMEFQSNLSDSANTLFGFNMAIVGSSNLFMFGKIMDVKSPVKLPTAWANQRFLGIGTRKTAEGTVEAIKATRAQNILAKSFTLGKTPIVEGAWEEGMQSSGHNTAKVWMEHTYDPKRTKETVDLGLDFVEGMGKTYTSKEGWKEIGIGMIIGLISGTGVSVARGKGLFGDLKDARKAAEDEAIIRNEYTAEKLIERIHTANRVAAFGKQAEEFDEKGDITGAELSRASAMIAHATAAYNFGYMDEALAEVKQGVQTMDNETIMKQYGLESLDEVQGVKDVLVADYTRLAKEYKKQRDFVGYMINNKAKEFGSDASITKVQEALAYELTLGSRAHEFSGELLGDIQKTLAGFYNTKGETISNALKAQDILWSASREVRRDFKDTQKRLKQAKAEKVRLEKERLSIEGRPPSKDENTSDLGRLNAVTTNIEITDREILSLNTQLEGVLSAAALQNPYSQEDTPAISAEELENVDMRLNDVVKLIDDVKKMNAREGYRLEGLLKEYQKSKTAFTRYADLSRQLSDPKLGLRGRRNIITELRSDKDPNEATRTFINEMGSNMTRITQERKDEADEVAVRKAVTKMERTPLEAKKVATIQDIIEDNPYLFEYVGTAENAVKPTEEEIQEYKALLTRIKRSRRIDNRKATQNKPDYYARKGQKIPLTKAEMARFQELNQKVSDWRFYESAMNDEGISMADLIEQEISRVQEPVEVEIQDELTIDDYVLVSTPTEAAPNTPQQRNADIIQTYDTVKVQVMDGMYYFSHLNLSSLLKGDYKVTMKTPKTVDDNGFVTEWNKPVEASPQDVIENQKKYGTYFTIKTASGDLTAAVTSQGRLQIPVAEFARAKAELGMDIFKQLATRTTFADVYESNAEGEYIIKDSDFKLEQELGAQDVLEYMPEETMELQAGENVFFKVNVKDSYNAELKEKYDNDEITYDMVVDQVKVYNTATNGKIVGDLKSNQGILEGSENFLNIRRIAADVLTQKTTTQDMVTIPYVAKVKYVLIGTPNLTMVKTEDGMIPQSIELTDGAVEQVMDYGYMENGKLVLKGGTKDVRQDFVSKLSKKSNIPVIVFKQGSYLVAYPVSMIKRGVDNIVEVNKVLASKLNNSEKVTVINTILAENGIKPNLKYITEEDQNLFSSDGSLSPEVQGHLTALAQTKETAKVEDWMEDGHTKEMLKDEITLTIDLGGRVLKSPKVIIDFDGAQMNQAETPWYDTYVATGEVSDEKIHEIANKAVEAGLNIKPTTTNYVDIVVKLKDEAKAISAQITPLDAELKQIRAPKGKALTLEQENRRNEIMDIIDPLRDELRVKYQQISMLNANPTMSLVSKESVFSNQELAVYTNEAARIKTAIDEIVKLDTERQKQADEEKRKEC